jgi:hypothetical protein
MHDPRRFAGPMLTDAARGLHGGTCELTLAGDAFALRIEWRHAYGIEETDTVHGVVEAGPAGLVLVAQEWHRVTIETTAVQALRPLARRWPARWAGPVDDAPAALAVEFALGADAVDVLLLREPAAGEVAAPALAGWFHAACAGRQAAVDAARQRRIDTGRADRRAADSAQAFASGDFASVVALLAPDEGHLSRAEAMRLALARQRMGGR